MAPFYGWGSTFSKLLSHFEDTVYFSPIINAQLTFTCSKSTAETLEKCMKYV